MKITRTRLKEIVREKIEEGLTGYFGGIDPVKHISPKHAGTGTVRRVRAPEVEEKVAEIISKIGKDEFVEALLKTLPDEKLNAFIENIAKDNNLTIGGIQYFENKEINEADDEYTKLGTPKEDPMGRGSRTSALRKGVMGPKLVDKEWYDDGPGYTPEQQKVANALEDLIELIYNMERSNPEMTDLYIGLLRALQQSGVKISALASMV